MRHDEGARNPPVRRSASQVIVMRASVPGVGVGLVVAARALLLLGLFPSVLGRLMMTNDAAGAGAENAVMSSIMPGDSADGGAL